jgi:hypothetical protein
MTLERHGETTASALAAPPRPLAPPASRAIESLQRAGVLTRAKDPADRHANRPALAFSRREASPRPSERDALSPCRRSWPQCYPMPGMRG